MRTGLRGLSEVLLEMSVGSRRTQGVEVVGRLTCSTIMRNVVNFFSLVRPVTIYGKNIIIIVITYVILEIT